MHFRGPFEEPQSGDHAEPADDAERTHHGSRLEGKGEVPGADLREEVQKYLQDTLGLTPKIRQWAGVRKLPY